MSRKSRGGSALLIGVMVLGGLAGCDETRTYLDQALDAATGLAEQEVSGSTPGVDVPVEAPPIEAIEQASATLPNLDVAPRHPVDGYERGCGDGQACSFGATWTDESNAPGSGNGCGTRQDVLAAQLDEVTFEDGSDCIVTSGVLQDPYTGQSIPVQRGGEVTVDIDHVFPLALAWDMGAAEWPQSKRTEFANDIELNLLASDSSANRSKGDQGPGSWMPPNRGFHCGYAVAYVDVADEYDLALTSADVDVLTEALTGCEAPKN